MNTIISAVTYLIEYFIAIHFFSELFPQKLKSKRIHLTGIVLYAVACTVFVAFENVVLNTILFFLINFIFALSCFRTGALKALLGSLFITAIMNGAEFLSMCILSAGNGGDINTYNSSIASYMTAVLYSKILYFVFIRLILSAGFRFSNKNLAVNPFFLILFPLCSLVILYTFFLISSAYELTKEIELIISLSGIGIMSAIILTYIFYGKTAKQIDELYASQSETEKISTDAAYYALVDRQNDMLKTFIHDEKNHLSAIKSLADSSEVNEYIDSIYGQIKSYSLFGNTKNKMLDFLINKYYYICENESIDFSTSIITSNLHFIEQADLISLMSNILDNAVDSAKNSEAKIIDLSINKVNGFDILTCTNSCNKRPDFKGRILKSTKAEGGLHGLGIKSIQKTVNKYNGEFEWSFNEKANEFTVYAAFKAKAEDRP